MPFVLEQIVLVITAVLFVQLITSSIEENKYQSRIVIQSNRAIKGRFWKILFFGVYYMYKKRPGKKTEGGEEMFPNWDANKISPVTFWFGVVSYIVYIILFVLNFFYYYFYPDGNGILSHAGDFGFNLATLGFFGVYLGPLIVFVIYLGIKQSIWFLSEEN